MSATDAPEPPADWMPDLPPDRRARAWAAVRQFGRALDEIDEQTRRDGEPPLRSVVAQHAREQRRTP